MIRRRLLTGTLSNFAGRFTTAGLWFVLTPFVLARLEPSGYALWVLMSAVASYGSLLELGIGGAVVKYVAEHVARGERDAAMKVISSSFLVYLGLGIATFAVSVAIAPALSHFLTLPAGDRSIAAWLVIVTGLYVGISIAFTPWTSLLRGLQRHDLANGVQVIGSLLLAAATVTALLVGWGVLGMVAMNVPVNIVMGLASAALCRRAAPDLIRAWRGVDLATLRRITSFSTSLFVIDVAACLRSKSDAFVIALFRPISAVTPYALAKKLADLNDLVVTQFLKVLVPLASELDAGDRARKLRTLHIVASRLALAVAIPIAVVLIVVGEAVLSVWVGPEYAQYAGLVDVLAIASLLATAQAPAARILQGIARHRIVAATSIAAGVANVALAVLLLPRFGLMGAAVASLIPAAVTAFAVIMPFANRTLSVTWRDAMREIWLPGVLPGVVAGVVLCILYRATPAPSSVMLAAWIVTTMLAYAVVYLLMPASSAERRLLSDGLSGGLSFLSRKRIPARRLGDQSSLET
jgi:O-antigen/teichoic acid export membrane protein